LKSKRIKKSIQKIELPPDMYNDLFTIEEHLIHLGKEKWSIQDYKLWLRDRFYRGRDKDYRVDYWAKRRFSKDRDIELFDVFDEGKIINIEDESDN
jgi:hypothetical protein